MVGGFLFFRCRSDVSGLSYCSTLGLVNAGAFKDRGIERMKKGDDEGAIADFERAIEINPKEADAFYNMGLIKGEIRDYKSALTFMNKADAIRPNEKYKRRIGEYKSEIERLERERLERERLERIENITADYNKAIEIDPQDADAYNNRGFAKNKSGDYQGAIADFNKALAINPQDYAAYTNRGIAKRNLGDDRGGCADFKKAVSLGDQGTAQWLNSEVGAWCRNMR